MIAHFTQLHQNIDYAQQITRRQGFFCSGKQILLQYKMQLKTNKIDYENDMGSEKFSWYAY